jgi:hypothetical protein
MLVSVTQQGTAFELISAIHHLFVFTHGYWIGRRQGSCTVPEYRRRHRHTARGA